MNRRDFLLGTAAISALSTLPSPLMANELTWKEAFAAALKKDPRLLGFSNYPDERETENLVIEGKIPNGLEGTFYRNGPAIMERNDIRYKHLFLGDGMIQAFFFKDGKVSFKNRFVRTEKFKREEKAERFLYDLGGYAINDNEPVTSADTINVGNINVIPVGDDIWALWEAGSAYQLNAKSLETKNIVTLSNELKGMPFSAHPKIDPDGTIWNFGLNYATGQIILYKVSKQGKLQYVGVVETNYHAMLHDFLITEKHILLILPSVTIDENVKEFTERQRYAPNQPTQVLVIDKNDFSVKSRHEFDPCFIFHFGNAWEENDGTIRFDASRYPNLDVMNELGYLMRGETIMAASGKSHTVIFSIFPNGKTSEQHFNGNTEFPRIFPSVTGKRNKKLFTIGQLTSSDWQDSVRSLDMENGNIDQYHYGEEFMVEEHIIIENDIEPEKGGWLIGTALHWPSKRSCVNIFNAENISAGPVARAWLPFHIPLGFHGNFKSI